MRYLVKIDGHWLYSILIFDGYSRAIVGAGCFDRQNLSGWSSLPPGYRPVGCAEAVVSDHVAVFLALAALPRSTRHSVGTHSKGHPWQNLAEGGFSIQRRMLDAYVVGCPDRETVYRQHAQFVQRLPVLGALGAQTPGCPGTAVLRVARGHTRECQGRDDRGQPPSAHLPPPPTHTPGAPAWSDSAAQLWASMWIRSLWGQTLDVLIYDEALRIEQAEHLLVSYPCVYDTRLRRITTVHEQGRQQYGDFQVIQLMLWTLGVMRLVWQMPPYRWSQRPRRVLHAHQQSLFESFAQ